MCRGRLSPSSLEANACGSSGNTITQLQPATVGTTTPRRGKGAGPTPTVGWLGGQGITGGGGGGVQGRRTSPSTATAGPGPSLRHNPP